MFTECLLYVRHWRNFLLSPWLCVMGNITHFTDGDIEAGTFPGIWLQSSQLTLPFSWEVCWEQWIRSAWFEILFNLVVQCLRICLSVQGILFDSGFPCGSHGKEPAHNAGDLGSIPGPGRSRGEGYGNPPSILAWRIPWTEEPGGLQSMGSQRVGHDWVTIFIHSFFQELRSHMPWNK